MKELLKREYIVPVVTIIICLAICKISKKIVSKIFNLKKNSTDGKKKTIVNLINNIIKFIVALLGIIIILETYGIDTKSLVASFGVAGLVAGLALQDLLKDLIVGILIIFEGEYSIGDWVTINGFKGEVLSSNLRTTKLKAPTGEIKIISNRNISEIINYSISKANLLIDLDVAYESDIKKVKEILDELCVELKKEYNLKEMSCLGIQELASSSIKFRLKVVSNYEEQFDLERKIKEKVVLEFNKNNITIPYSQLVIHNE